MKPAASIESATPVFIRAGDAPWELTVEEICEAAEAKIGNGNIAGAVLRGTVWRVHAKTVADKISLMVVPTLTIKKKSGGAPQYESEGDVIRVTVTLHSKNPNNIVEVDGKEVESVKLLIDGLFLSVSMEDVKTSLEKEGITVRSKIFFDKARREDKSLSPWVNGRRFVYINEPTESSPVPRHVMVGDFRATLYHRGMKKPPLTCWDCKGPHKRGDKGCPNLNKKVWSGGPDPKEWGRDEAEKFILVLNELRNRGIDPVTGLCNNVGNGRPVVQNVPKGGAGPRAQQVGPSGGSTDGVVAQSAPVVDGDTVVDGSDVTMFEQVKESTAESEAEHGAFNDQFGSAMRTDVVEDKPVEEENGSAYTDRLETGGEGDVLSGTLSLNEEFGTPTGVPTADLPESGPMVSAGVPGAGDSKLKAHDNILVENPPLINGGDCGVVGKVGAVRAPKADSTSTPTSSRREQSLSFKEKLNSKFQKTKSSLQPLISKQFPAVQRKRKDVEHSSPEAGDKLHDDKRCNTNVTPPGDGGKEPPQVSGGVVSAASPTS